MANVTFTPQDYTSTLAMLFHEAGGPAVQSLLKRGDTANALGYVSGLIDTWANRSAATGTPMWQLMNQPNQISHWDSSQIQQKANSLDPRIKSLADAYLTNRADGGANFNPGVVNYMNTEFVKDDNPNGSWKSWYDPKNVVGAYGDYKDGRNSLQTEFITQPKKQPVPDYTFSFDKSLKLSPTEAAQQAYSTLAGRLSGLKAPQAGTDGFGANTNVSGDAGDGTFGGASGVVETGSPYYFSQGDFSNGADNGSFGAGIIPNQDVTRFGQGFNPSGGLDPMGGLGSFQGTFDPAQYLAANPDVAAGGADPLQHYLTYGYQEGRSLDAQGDRINQGFDPSAYLAANPDVAASGANPLQHYLQYGAHEGRTADFSGSVAPGNFGAGIYQPASIDTLGLDPAGSVFRPDQINADFSGSPLDPAPIATSGGFDPSAYLAANPDVAASGADPLQHWLRFGQAEGRPLAPSGQAAIQPYGFSSADASGGVGPGAIGQQLDSYPDTSSTAFGGGFDPSAYLAANPDVAASGADPLQHWLRFGQAEGRPLTPDANSFTGNANGAPNPISADFSGSPLSPIDPGNPFAAPSTITADFGSPLSPVPTGPNVSQGVGPGTFQGTFNAADYLAANPDIAARHVDPLQHYLTYGYQEGRALDPQGDRINQGFDASQYFNANPDAAASGVSALQHYIQYGAHEGRSADFSGGVAPGSFGSGIYQPASVGSLGLDPAASVYNPGSIGGDFSGSPLSPVDPSNPIAYPDALQANFGADLTPVPTGPNVSQGVGNGTFHGTFNAADYLAANPDVAASGADPLTHYLTYGYNEGRALDTVGDRISRAFDPTAYLQANPDVAAAHVDPLRHYLESGAAEGRALPTGTNPYSFSNFNTSQGLGPTGNGAMGFGGLGSMGGGQGMPDLGYDGGGFDASGGVPNGSFGLGGVTAGSPNYGGGYSPFNGGFNPYGFSGANVGGGLGATAQSMGGYYPAGGGQSGGLDPYGFSQANVGGFDPNSFGGGSVEDFGSGEGLGPTQWNDAPQAGGDGGGGASGFDHNASELAFLRGQMDQLAARDAALAASNNANIGFANASAARSGQLDAVGAGNAAKQFAGIQAGLGIAPVAGVSFAPGPVGIATIGGIGPMNFGMAGLGGAPLRGFL